MTLQLRSLHSFVLASLLCLALALPARAERVRSPHEIPPYDAADPDAPEVTPENLLANDRFWPYQVELVEPWQPPGRKQPLPTGIPFALVRAEEGGKVRVDFGRDGKFELAVEQTDVLARANRIRRGELAKMAPNFVLSTGPRLVDSTPGARGMYGLDRVGEARGFLAVFADPGDEGFPALVAALAPLQRRHGILTVFFPQGQHSNEAVLERLQALSWPAPFMLTNMSEAYARIFLEEPKRPALQLQTVDGRVVAERNARPEEVPALAAALDAAFAESSRPAGR